MEEPAFPRGRPDAAVKKKEDENEDETPRDKRFKKRDGTNHHTNKKRPASDFLFGSKKPEKTSKKKKKTTTAADSTVTSSGKKSLLPMGGGGVVFPPDNKPGWIESLSFSKLVKGMRLLGCVREVYADLIVFSLPNLWTGYMLCGSNTKPLVSVGQYMSVVIVKAVQEATKDGPRRRIQVSCLPSVVNTSEKLVGSVRGQVLSAEDHGILVDLGLGRQGFLPYESIEGAFTVDEEFEENGITRILAHKRVDDFLLAQNARDSKVLKLTLPGRKDMAAQFLNETPTLAALQPGALVKVSVESIVRNGVCVSFSSGVFRGAIETSHIGCTFVPENKLPNEQWKALFQDHKKLVARILAVDATSKIVRLSLQPHLITLEPPASLPAVGSVIENATVVRVDPGLGAVLALPGDAEVDENMATSSHNVELWADERYRSTSTVQTVYVHISKAVDEQKGSRTSDAVFAKEFAPSTQHKVRILSNANTIDCIASGATAKSVVEAHVLTIADLTPGKTFRQVPVCAHVNGGGVLVDFGMGVRGLIAPLHLFDHTATSEYRTKMFKELYGLDCKVDVRVLSVDQATKRCYLTAKRSLIKCKEIITSFDDVKIGQQTVGFVSHVDEKSLSVTFFNGVYGKVTARSLAADLGIDNLKENYTVGDAVNCRVANVKQRNRRSKNSVMAEEDDAENIGATYWELTLSLRSSSAKDLDKKSGMEVDPENSNSTAPIALKPGILLPARSMKVVQLQMGKAKDKGFVPGYAIVSIKSKYLLDAKENRKLPQYVECKLPFDQLFDYYDADVASSANAMDALAQEHLKVGEKVDRKGIVLMDPLKSVAEYTTGTGSLAVVSIRPKLVSYFDERHADEQEFKDLICPSPETHLFMGAELLGYVVQVDARHGAFIRFLNGVTGLVPKLKGGLALPLYSTVSTRVIAIDVTALPPKILLGINKKEKPRAEKKRGLPKSYPKEGDTIDKAEIVSLDFHRASLKVLDAALESSDDCRVRLHYSLAKSKPIVKPVEITSADERRQLISRFHPFFGLKTGSVLRNLRVAAVDNRGDKVYYELTNLVQDDTRSPAFFHNVSNVKVGMKVSGTVASIDHSKGGIYLQLCPGVSGFIPALELSEKAEVLNRLDVHYPIGCRLECLVIDKKAWLQNRSKYHVGHVKKMQSKETQNDTPYLSVIKRQIEGSNFVKPTKGSLVLGRINRKVPSANPPALMLDLRGGFIGRCCITEVDEPDDWRNMPIGRISVSESKEPVTAKETQHHPEESDHEEQILRPLDEKLNESPYRHGMFVACRVLEPLPSQPACADVSLRQSRLDGDIDDDEQPEVGELRNAYVIDTNAKGCFIRLSRQTEGRVLLKEICDGFLPDPKSSFPAGRLVVGKIKALQKNKRKGPYKWVVDVDMRESVILAEGKLKFEQIVVGGKFKGVVTRIEDYGVFVRIENSDVFGLVHKSECSDNFVKNLSDLYDPGDLVKVLVLKVDSDKKQLGFSMKASHFEDDEDSDSDASVDSDFMRAENDGSDSSDAQALDSDDDDYVAKLAASSRRRHRSESFDHGASEEDAHSSESEDSDAGESDSSEQDAQKDDKAMMDTDVGFVWDAHASQDSDASKNNDSDGDDDELSSEDDQVHKSSHKSRRKHAQRIREEQEIARREAALADGTANEKPETAADFERLLSGEPNNSELWIKYMAFHMSLADIPAARKVAERAFQRIEFRQEREKMNVWSALLTLELRYGSEKSFQECMDRACKHNNPKYVFLRVCEMLEREAVGSSGESMQRCHDMYMKLTKKFKDKKKAWLAHIEYLLRNNRHEDAHALSKRAMQSLPPHKHFETISRFAQLVFEHGNPERARTLFEGLLLKYSKRLDLFFVYIDKEIKHGDIKHARGLFEKQVVSDSSSGKMKLNDKQMKSFFKKWFSVEEQYGTLATQERVKEAARLYVQQTSIN